MPEPLGQLILPKIGFCCTSFTNKASPDTGAQVRCFVLRILFLWSTNWAGGLVDAKKEKLDTRKRAAFLHSFREVFKSQIPKS